MQGSLQYDVGVRIASQQYPRWEKVVELDVNIQRKDARIAAVQRWSSYLLLRALNEG